MTQGRASALDDLRINDTDARCKNSAEKVRVDRHTECALGQFNDDEVHPVL